MDETTSRFSGANESERKRRSRVARHAMGWVSGAALVFGACLARAQEPPPASAPSGITTVDPNAPPGLPGAQAAEPVAPAPSPEQAPPAPPAPPPSVILVAPEPPPAPPVVAIVTPAPAPAPAWSPVFTGSYFTRYELRSGFDDLGLSSPTYRQRFLEGDSVFYRVRFGIGTGLFEIGPGIKVGLQFTPQTTGVFGNLSNTGQAPNTIIDASIGLHEGYARVQGAYTRFDAGRFELNYGDALVLGNLDWNEVGRSFDGVRARIAASPSSAWLDLFATLLDEGRPDFPRGGTLDNSPGLGFGDIYFLGAYAALGPSITKGLDLDLYGLVRTWSDTKNLRITAADPMSPVYRRESAADVTFGLRAKQKLGAFDYRLEAGAQAGSRPGAAPTAMAPASVVENVDAVAYHADLELGLSFGQDKFRASVEGLYASGDDPTTRDKREGWDELFPTAHKFQGLADAFVQAGQKRTNVMSGVLHLTLAAAKNLAFQADGHLFSRPEPSALNGPKGFAGGEVDVGAVYTLAKGLKLRALYCIFLPDSHIYRDTLPVATLAKGPDPVHFTELELRYDMLP